MVPIIICGFVIFRRTRSKNSIVANITIVATRATNINPPFNDANNMSGMKIAAMRDRVPNVLKFKKPPYCSSF